VMEKASTGEGSVGAGFIPSGELPALVLGLHVRVEDGERFPGVLKALLPPGVGLVGEELLL